MFKSVPDSKEERRPSEGWFKATVLSDSVRKEELVLYAREVGQDFLFDILDTIDYCQEATDDTTMRERLYNLFRDILSVKCEFSFDVEKCITSAVQKDMITRRDAAILLCRLESDLTRLLINLHLTMPSRKPRNKGSFQTKVKQLLTRGIRTK